MSTETTPEIPEQIEELMRDEEIENMRSLDGWAVGNVVRVDEDGQFVELFENVWIELFNGDGRASKFGGVRFMWVDGDEQYGEAYGYPNGDAAHGNYPCYYVVSWVVPDDPDVGQEVPA